MPITKLAAIREQGYPQGVSAPCWFHCPCGDKVPAFQGEQTCACGARYDGRGWLLSKPEQYNHIFRTFLGLPPSKGDKPLCGADLPDSWDFPGHDRPACPACQKVASNG